MNICIDIYDEFGVGGGASGVSGGLLHPYSPKGLPPPPPPSSSFFILPKLLFHNFHDSFLGFLPAKLLWRGAECWDESMKLLRIAEAAMGFKETAQLYPDFQGFIVRRRFFLLFVSLHRLGCICSFFEIPFTE